MDKKTSSYCPGNHQPRTIKQTLTLINSFFSRRNCSGSDSALFHLRILYPPSRKLASCLRVWTWIPCAPSSPLVYLKMWAFTLNSWFVHTTHKSSQSYVLDLYANNSQNLLLWRVTSSHPQRKSWWSKYQNGLFSIMLLQFWRANVKTVASGNWLSFIPKTPSLYVPAPSTDRAITAKWLVTEESVPSNGQRVRNVSRLPGNAATRVYSRAGSCRCHEDGRLRLYACDLSERYTLPGVHEADSWFGGIHVCR